MSEKPELIAFCPDSQAWKPSATVEWINRSELHLQEAGLIAVGFWNGAVFLASSDQKIEVGDQVKITEVKFSRPGHENSHCVHVVSSLKT